MSLRVIVSGKAKSGMTDAAAAKASLNRATSCWQ